MTTTDITIALAFSGGGYRASSFNLGVLTLLGYVDFNGEPLLKKVNILSTVSGGTITGSRYAVGIKKGESLRTIFHSLYEFMSREDLVTGSLTLLTSNDHWKNSRIKSLINAFADIYDSKLFNKAEFGLLLKEDPSIHLKHISFNATEFTNGLQFRFQVSEKLLKPAPNEPDRGIIGNINFNVPVEHAASIRMGDILAASSCFPGGFEPINFPTDFIISDAAAKYFKAEALQYPVGLMDGGIVDNQGIEPILLAEKRIKKNTVASNEEKQGNAIDLIIVSDVASPYMKEFVASTQKPLNWWRRFTPYGILATASTLLLISVISLIVSFINNSILFSIISSVFLTVSLVTFLISEYITRLPRKFHVPSYFLKPFTKLLKISLQVYENLILNRSNSILKLTGNIFLKHIRRLNYEQLFGSDDWKNRRIMNAIYELRTGEKRITEKLKAGVLSKQLIPSVKVQEVATKAAEIGTTLWYTQDQLESDPTGFNTLDAAIACGQFTMCWNLLEYIGKIKKDNSNTNTAHAALVGIEHQLWHLWKQFQEDPWWLLREYKQ